MSIGEQWIPRNPVGVHPWIVVSTYSGAIRCTRCDQRAAFLWPSPPEGYRCRTRPLRQATHSTGARGFYAGGEMSDISAVRSAAWMRGWEDAAARRGNQVEAQRPEHAGVYRLGYVAGCDARLVAYGEAEKAGMVR